MLIGGRLTGRLAGLQVVQLNRTRLGAADRTLNGALDRAVQRARNRVVAERTLDRHVRRQLVHLQRLLAGLIRRRGLLLLLQQLVASVLQAGVVRLAELTGVVRVNRLLLIVR